jgi:hypothetical protein
MRFRVDEVGKPYVGAMPIADSVQYNYRNGQHALELFMTRPRASELREMSRGPWEFALIVRPETLFLLFRAGSGPWMDAPYSWWQVQRLVPAEAVAPFELPTASSRALLVAVVVSLPDGIVRLLGSVTFSPAFSRALHDAIRAQMAREVSAEAYSAAVSRYYRLYQTEEMLPHAVARCTGGGEA